MAGEFPVYTTKSLPRRGPSAFLDVDTRTGAGLEAAAISELGESLMGVGIIENRLQADTELADAIMADRQAIQEFAISLESNTDPHTYGEEFNKTLDIIQNREIKNGLAAREHGLWVKRMTPGWQKALGDAKKARIDSNYFASLFTAQQQAIQTGSVSGFQGLLAEGVAAGKVSEDQAEKMLFDTRHKAERRSAEEFAMQDPEGMLATIKADKIEGYELLTPGDVIDIRSIALGQINYRGSTLRAAQDQAGREMLIALWKGELTDLTKITDALEKDLITTTMAKSLRQAMLQPLPVMPAEQLAAEAVVRDTINRYHAGDITKQEALEFLYSKAGVLGQTKGSQLLNRLYDAPDKAVAEMKREGKSLMEEYIRTRDRISGYFTDDKKEIMGTAEAVLLLDIEIEKAERAGKPLGRRDILIKAMEIGQQVRAKIDKMGKKDVPTLPVELGHEALPKSDKRRSVGSVALSPEGVEWGTYNTDGTITLSEFGVNALLDITNNNVAEARKLASKHGLIIPK